MKRQYILMILAGAIIVIAFGMGLSRQAVASATPTAEVDHTAIGSAVFDHPLQCGIKVANGLAQCGSAASSCKNCHEVKAEDAVNAKGDWHTQHAFGDFCEFCHAGNVQATDKNAAHQGLVDPLGDVKANCSSCHADDYQAKAQTYATTLGVTIGTSTGGAAQPPAAPAAPSAPAAGTTASTAPQAPAASAPIAAPTSSNEVIDYAVSTPPANGNVIAAIVLVLMIIAGAALVYWNEKRLRRLAIPKSTEGYVTYETDRPSDVNIPSRTIPAEEPLGEVTPELAKLLPVLRSLDPRTLRALRIILSDRKRGEELLQSLSLINFGVLEEMKRLDKKELSLLLALASES
ncbi:MAG TPA: hypothetical protein VFK30_07205 [Anaerolineae bacterium]|nr:hypothetical protein [Anaerolineae bacterium]